MHLYSLESIWAVLVRLGAIEGSGRILGSSGGSCRGLRKGAQGQHDIALRRPGHEAMARELCF